MPEITISFPQELKSKIEAHSEIDWSVIFRHAAQKMLHKLALVKFLETKLDKSEFAEKDAEELSERVNLDRLKELKSRGII